MKNNPATGVISERIKMEILDPKDFQVTACHLESAEHSDANESLHENESNCMISQFDDDSDLSLMQSLQSQNEGLQGVFSEVSTGVNDHNLNDDSNNLYGPEGIIISETMDIRTRLSELMTMLEDRINISLTDYEFWLQDSKKLESHKNLADQCIRGEGPVQFNINIKPLMKRINIVDILKPPEEDHIEFVTPYEENSLDDNGSRSSTIQIGLENTQVLNNLITKVAKNSEAESSNKKSNCVKWTVDAQFAADQRRLGIPEDPRSWTIPQVKYWIQWAVRHFNLTGIKLSDWSITGEELCSLTIEQFKAKCPSDPISLFWTHLELLRKCKFIAVIQNDENQKPSDDSIELPEDEIMPVNRKKAKLSQQIVMESKMLPYYTGLYSRTGTNGQIQLWQFLLELLTSTEHMDVIRWIGSEGEFKLQEPEKVAKLWGLRKHKPTMNYEKLSRALRYYYDGDMIAKVHNRRFVYRFVCDLKQLIGYDAKDLARLVADGNPYNFKDDDQYPL